MILLSSISTMMSVIKETTSITAVSLSTSSNGEVVVVRGSETVVFVYLAVNAVAEEVSLSVLAFIISSLVVALFVVVDSDTVVDSFSSGTSVAPTSTSVFIVIDVSSSSTALVDNGTAVVVVDAFSSGLALAISACIVVVLSAAVIVDMPSSTVTTSVVVGTIEVDVSDISKDPDGDSSVSIASVLVCITSVEACSVVLDTSLGGCCSVAAVESAASSFVSVGEVEVLSPISERVEELTPGIVVSSTSRVVVCSVEGALSVVNATDVVSSSFSTLSVVDDSFVGVHVVFTDATLSIFVVSDASVIVFSVVDDETALSADTCVVVSFVASVVVRMFVVVVSGATDVDTDSMSLTSTSVALSSARQTMRRLLTAKNG